jgi:hypothetical protein
MKKTYTVLSITHTIISPGKGSIIWQLSDEQERPRKVNAVTSLDKQGLVDSARSIYAREAPLVAVLMQRTEGETFSIDFTPFNEANGYINREMYSNLQKCERLGCLARKVWRVLVVVGLLIVLWLGWTLYGSVAEFAHKQPTRPHELH